MIKERVGLGKINKDDPDIRSKNIEDILKLKEGERGFFKSQNIKSLTVSFRLKLKKDPNGFGKKFTFKKIKNEENQFSVLRWK